MNAGHPAGCLVRDGAARPAFESGGQPLGLLPAATYVTIELTLSPGDIGVLVTDGITEALEGGPTTLSRALALPPERSAPLSPGDI